MRYNQLGRTGLKVSALACGTNALRRHTQEEADLALNYALDRGINLVETGRPYGETEDMVRRAIGHRRQEYVLISKTTQLDGEAARKEVDTSLQLLGTDYLDGYQVAGANSDEALARALARALAPGGALEALQEARRDGKIGFVGMIGHRPDVLARAVQTGQLDLVLYIFNMVHAYARLDLMPLCREMNVGTMVMRPMDHGALAPASTSLRYALSFGHDCVLCGMYSPAHVDENLAIAAPEFTDAERAALKAEGDALAFSGCRRCHLCTPCPHGIAIPVLLSWFHYRERYHLMPPAEAEWQVQAARARECDDCGLCEPRCPYGLAITPLIHQAAATAPQAS